MLRIVIALALCSGAVAGAAPYSVSYEGNVLPEDDGWERFHGYDDNEADRYIDNGVLVIDSMHDGQVYDYVTHDASPATAMEPGELLVVEWRTYLAATEGRDAIFALILGDWTEDFTLGYDHVHLGWLRINVPVTPEVWHTYRIEMTPSYSYIFFIDAEPRVQASLFEVPDDREIIAFGDGAIGARSISHWDYVHCDVVPEPGTTVLLLVCVHGWIRRFLT